MTPIGTESKTVTKLSQKCTNDECKIRVSERLCQSVKRQSVVKLFRQIQ